MLEMDCEQVTHSVLILALNSLNALETVSQGVNTRESLESSLTVASRTYRGKQTVNPKKKGLNGKNCYRRRDILSQVRVDSTVSI